MGASGAFLPPLSMSPHVTDGEFLNGSTTHTKKEQGNWWQVDLGSKKNINQNQLNTLSGSMKKFVTQNTIKELTDDSTKFAVTGLLKPISPT
jgi:hypothetical protein